MDAVWQMLAVTGLTLAGIGVATVIHSEVRLFLFDRMIEREIAALHAQRLENEGEDS